MQAHTPRGSSGCQLMFIQFGEGHIQLDHNEASEIHSRHAGSQRPKRFLHYGEPSSTQTEGVIMTTGRLDLYPH
jgi:hypothetical protein